MGRISSPATFPRVARRTAPKLRVSLAPNPIKYPEGRRTARSNQERPSTGCKNCTEEKAWLLQRDSQFGSPARINLLLSDHFNIEPGSQTKYMVNYYDCLFSVDFKCLMLRYKCMHTATLVSIIIGKYYLIITRREKLRNF